MLKAIKELNESGYDIPLDKFKFIKSDETRLDNNNLYYKSVNEGLLLLVNSMFDSNKVIKPAFKNFGTMLDLSRGAVFKVSYIKELIRKQALMGVNEIWLYMEDMYEISDNPTFGYNRGRYSKEELVEIVNYATIFDIRLVPAIQTLGHMEQFLSWHQVSHLKDQKEVLLTRNNETYSLIDKMFKSLKEIFKHDKIHMGLDETFGFGFGNFYKKNGYVEPMELFLEHLTKVNDLAIKNGFSNNLIWSDMFFRFLSEVEYYYDPNIKFDRKILDRIPNNVSLVYWDYYNKNSELVDKMIKNHYEMGKKFVFASGTWIWTRLTYDKSHSDLTAKMHLLKAKENSVEDFILTQWMDDGAYGDHLTTLLGVYELALDAFNIEVNSSVYKFITNDSYEKAVIKTKLNDTTISQVGLLYDETLYSTLLNSYTHNEVSLFDKFIKEQEELVNLLKDDKYYNYEYLIAKSNYYKLLGRKAMVDAYQNKKEMDIESYFNEQYILLEELLNSFRSKWYQRYKFNGFEIIQSRIVLKQARAKEMILIAKMYNENKNLKIEALELDYVIKDNFFSLKHSNLAFTTKPFF